MLKKLLAGAGVIGCVGMMGMSSALANTVGNNPPQANKSLVALGDSITYGYNLNTNAQGKINDMHTSKDAFPYLIGSDESMSVHDLGVPGWTSSDLLTALQSNEQMMQDVRHADVITIDIGSNDLLHTLQGYTGDVTTLKTHLLPIINQLVSTELPAILKSVRTLNPHASIVVYNIYNPFPSTNALGSAGNQLLELLNFGPDGHSGIEADVAHAGSNVYYADAFTAFFGKQAEYVRNGDVHPTVAGQAVLAQVGEAALGK